MERCALSKSRITARQILTAALFAGASLLARAAPLDSASAGPTPLWVAEAAPSTSPAKPDATDTTRSAAGVLIGSKSASLKHLVSSVIGPKYRCAAVAMMMFDPPSASADTRPWNVTLPGVPTAETVRLTAESAARAKVDDSTFKVSRLPFDPDATLYVALRIWTQADGPDTALSTVACSFVDINDFPTDNAPIEPPLRFRWRTASARLIAIYN